LPRKGNSQKRFGITMRDWDGIVLAHGVDA
jgi:hypothetical protein